MIKTVLIAASCLGIFASTTASAQIRHQGPNSQRGVTVERKVIQAPARNHVRPHEVRRHKQVRPHRWARGQRVDNWRGRSEVRDYRRHGLRQPARDQRWVKVDNNYLLISMMTGIVAAVSAGR
jgi:Ni/Co efflux regulator RcnB